MRIVNRLRIVVFLLLFGFSTGYTVSAQSLSKDIELGGQGFEVVKNTMGIYKDKAMTAYLNKVGQKLVSNLDSALFEYKFYIVNEKSPNAFALPGGYIFITTGIIPILESEDELACIIGHEIIHSNNRHTIRQTRKRVIPVLLAMPVEIVASVVPGGELSAVPVKAINQLLFASYSRKFETEADNEGIVLAAKAGYDPMALPKILNRMNKAIELISGQTETKNYFADHPYTPDRIKNIDKKSEKLEIGKVNDISNEFLMEFNGVLFGESAANGVILNNTFLHPDLDFYVEYPKNWKIKNLDTAVVAVSSEKDATLVLSLDKPKQSAEQAAKKYVKHLSKKYKSIFVDAKPFKVNSIEGYLVSFQEVVYRDTTYAYVLWLKNRNNLFRLTAMSNGEQRADLLKIAQSIRSLTDSEKSTIMQAHLMVVKAKKGETMKSLSQRNGSKLKIEIANAINDKKAGAVLNKGELIKIVVDKPFSSE